MKRTTKNKPRSQRIRELRDDLGISQAELARRARVSSETVNTLENNDGHKANHSTIAAIATALNVSPELLKGPQ